MGERSQGSQLDQSGVGEVPAVACLQVLQRRQARAVLQRHIRQPLVALPAAPQLLQARRQGNSSQHTGPPPPTRLLYQLPTLHTTLMAIQRKTGRVPHGNT